MKRGLAITFERYVAAQRKTVAFRRMSIRCSTRSTCCSARARRARRRRAGIHRRSALQLDLDAGRHALRHAAGRHGRQGPAARHPARRPAPRRRQAALHRRLGRGSSRLRLAMPKINGERLLADLRRIADFGRYETGVHRPHLSPQDVESRHWLAGRMKEAGLEPVIDGVGTVIGRSPKSGPAPPDRLALRHPAARRLARRRDGRDLRPRSGARAGRGSRDGASRRRRRLVGRRGGPLGPDDRQPLVRRPLSPTPTSTRRAIATTARRCATR